MLEPAMQARVFLSNEFFGLMHTLSEFDYDLAGHEEDDLIFARRVRDNRYGTIPVSGREILIYQWVIHNAGI